MAPKSDPVVATYLVRVTLRTGRTESNGHGAPPLTIDQLIEAVRLGLDNYAPLLHSHVTAERTDR